MNNMRALIGMSGGVDSSVAVLLMKQAGYECIGATMRLYDNPTEESTCCSLEDVEDARAVAAKLGIRHYAFNFTEDFDRQVMRKFADSYERGLTPNPCIDCNRYLKFDRLLRRALELGCDWVVSGHYARIRQEKGRYLLYKAADATKDQTYFLACLNQEQLAHIQFGKSPRTTALLTPGSGTVRTSALFPAGIMGNFCSGTPEKSTPREIFWICRAMW